MNFYSLILMGLFTTVTSAHLPLESVTTSTSTASTIQDTVIELKPVVLDSSITINLPINYDRDVDNDPEMPCVSWTAPGINESIYFIFKSNDLTQEVCVDNKEQMTALYKITVNDWEDLNDTKDFKSRTFLTANGVFQASFNFIDLDMNIEYLNHYRLIYIEDTLYQIGFLSPKVFYDEELATAFFNSIVINPASTGKNQFTSCNSNTIDKKPKVDNEFYDAGYLVGFIPGVIACILIPAGLIVLVVFLIIRANNKKKHQANKGTF